MIFYSFNLATQDFMWQEIILKYFFTTTTTRSNKWAIFDKNDIGQYQKLKEIMKLDLIEEWS